LTKFLGKVEIQDSRSRKPHTRITLDGDKAGISAGGNRKNGDLVLYDIGGNERMIIGVDKTISALDASGKTVFAVFDKTIAGVLVGTDKEEGGKKAGRIVLRDKVGNASIDLDGGLALMTFRDEDGDDSIKLDGSDGSISVEVDGYGRLAFNPHALKGSVAGLFLGGAITPGYISIRGNRGREDSIRINGLGPNIILQDNVGKDSLKLDGEARKVIMQDISGKNSIILDGRTGDIMLKNADCAEDFDIVELAEAEPGNVMVISEDGKLQRSNKAYDTRVAGVISGAGDYKPGLVLDKKQSDESRRSISLIGKVYCKVDADSLPVEVGDMLTTSFVPGHAMKASDPVKAFGAVIGKALRPLRKGKALIPILIALQ